MYNFENKSIYFIGDSITESGGFIKYLREYFSQTKNKVFLHNKGIPGGRMDMVKFWLDEEFLPYTPDFAVVALGVNDLRIMLYDANNEESDAIIKNRQNFINVYGKSLQDVIQRLKNKGITPIVCSPFCVNENIIESNEIQTVVDNQDKKDIKESFYTKSTFNAINLGLKNMRDVAFKISQKMNVDFIDAYFETLSKVNSDCFYEDGIHYNENGHKVIAEILLKNLCDKSLNVTTPTANFKEIENLEFE